MLGIERQKLNKTRQFMPTLSRTEQPDTDLEMRLLFAKKDAEAKMTKNCLDVLRYRGSP